MNKNIVTILGIVLVAVGLIGFVAPDLLGMHLTGFHNIVHLVSGALAIYFGAKGTVHGARVFCFTFGAVYGLLGIAGFVGGRPADGMMTVIPDHFAVGTADHVVHVILGLAFIGLGAAIKPHAAVTIEQRPGAMHMP